MYFFRGKKGMVKGRFFKIKVKKLIKEYFLFYSDLLFML